MALRILPHHSRNQPRLCVRWDFDRSTNVDRNFPRICLRVWLGTRVGTASSCQVLPICMVHQILNGQYKLEIDRVFRGLEIQLSLAAALGVATTPYACLPCEEKEKPSQSFLKDHANLQSVGETQSASYLLCSSPASPQIFRGNSTTSLKSVTSLRTLRHQISTTNHVCYTHIPTLPWKFGQSQRPSSCRTMYTLPRNSDNYRLRSASFAIRPKVWYWG